MTVVHYDKINHYTIRCEHETDAYPECFMIPEKLK